MINGIDPQHLSTVHGIHIDMDIDIDETKSNHIEIVLKGKFPDSTLKERMGSIFLGKEYSYSMKYADGCLASLTMLIDAKLFNTFKLPSLHMLFSYSLVEDGKIMVKTIYLNKKSKGLLGPIKNFCKLNMTKLFFKMLQGEDGEIYDNIRLCTFRYVCCFSSMLVWYRVFKHLSMATKQMVSVGFCMYFFNAVGNFYGF